MKLITIGCSFTSGVGVHSFETYTHKLSNLLKCDYENYGEAGHSNKYIFRKTIELLKHWNDNDILIIQWTNPLRDEIITNEGYLFYPPYFDWFSLKFLYGNDVNNGLKKNGINNKDLFDKEIVNKKEKSVTNYCNNFFNKDYQLNLSFCYQFSLYGLLEKLGIKYLMFFGWEFQDIESQKEIHLFTNQKFISEIFGTYTNTISNEHPNKEGHSLWSEFLYSKIKELKYINNKLI